MPVDHHANVYDIFSQRFSDAPRSTQQDPKLDSLSTMAARGSCRSFTEQPVPVDWIEALCATALSSPTKSDLQQRDIVILKSTSARENLANLVSGQAWVADAPAIAVFCGNNRRQRLIHQHHDIPFANDHLDAFVNAAADAAIALGAFVAAAETLGLGCCPISAVRNEAPAVSRLLNLPDYVFPFAGLGFGFPTEPPEISKRLPLKITCHIDEYRQGDPMEDVAEYDIWRAQSHPYRQQRFPERFPQRDIYTWSEDKARQYSEPERADFGTYIRSIGFNLD